MSDTIQDCILVLVFIVIGGLFSAAELSLVSLRESQARTLAATRGRRGRQVAELAADPNRFLAAVQVGVTCAGFLSAAFGAATLQGKLSPVLRGWGLSAGLADGVALVGVTLVISYLSLVLGELTPKRIALQRTEGIALVAAPFVDRIARISRPVIWLLSRSTDLMVRILGGDPRAQREAISEEELRDMVATHQTLDPDERRLIDEVFSAADQQLREVMIPRTEVHFLDASMTVAEGIEVVSRYSHSRYPVVRGSFDEVVGFVHVRDLLDPKIAGRPLTVGDLSRTVMMMPATNKVLRALSDMRREGQHLTIVVDEYGGTAGIVAMEDLVEELVGETRDEYDVGPTNTTRRLVGGDVELDGLLNLEDFREETGIPLAEGPYETVAGYMVAQLGRIPEVGDAVRIDGHRLVAVEMDGRRVSRVRVTAAMPAAESGATALPTDPATRDRDGPATTEGTAAAPPPSESARSASARSESARSESARSGRARPPSRGA